MAGISNYLKDKLLDHVLRNTPYTPPTNIYIALYTDDPTEEDIGAEVSGGSYARQEITWAAISGHETVNSADVIFPVATAVQGTVTNYGIRDDSTVGNLLFFGEFDESRIITIGNRLKIATGEATATLT